MFQTTNQNRLKYSSLLKYLAQVDLEDIEPQEIELGGPWNDLFAVPVQTKNHWSGTSVDDIGTSDGFHLNLFFCPRK